MSEPATIPERTQRFNEAVRDFKLTSPSRHAKLMPLKDGIVELRQKGASLRLIRELLATVDVAVGTDTISPPKCGRSGDPDSVTINTTTSSTGADRNATGAFTHSWSANRRSSQPLIQRSFL
jgi:hypothetical protein